MQYSDDSDDESNEAKRQKIASVSNLLEFCTIVENFIAVAKNHFDLFTFD